MERKKTLCFNLQPSISRDSILTIDDFESADNQSDKATDKDDDSLETADEEVGQQIFTQYQRYWHFHFLKGIVEGEGSARQERPGEGLDVFNQNRMALPGWNQLELYKSCFNFGNSQQNHVSPPNLPPLAGGTRTSIWEPQQ